MKYIYFYHLLYYFHSILKTNKYTHARNLKWFKFEEVNEIYFFGPFTLLFSHHT